MNILSDTKIVIGIIFTMLSLSGNALAQSSRTLNAGSSSGDGVRDEFRVVLVGGSLQVLLNDAILETLDLNELASLTISGSTDDDTLTVDLSGGNPIPVGGLFYNGNEQTSVTGDLLVLGNGSATSIRHTYYNSKDGMVEIDERALSFTGLEPVVDTVTATTLTVNATNGANSITYVYEAPGGLLLAGGGMVAVDGFETISFINKTNLVIQGNAGDDAIVLANTVTPAGLTTITVNAGEGDDKVSVIGGIGQAVVLNGDGGDDLFKVLPTAVAAGSITVNGGTNILGDQLIVAGNNPGSVEAAQVTVTGFNAIPYTTLEDVQLPTLSVTRRILRARSPF